MVVMVVVEVRHTENREPPFGVFALNFKLLFVLFN